MNLNFEETKSIMSNHTFIVTVRHQIIFLKMKKQHDVSLLNNLSDLNHQLEETSGSTFRCVLLISVILHQHT